MPTLQYSRVVELSHPIHPDIPLWAGDPPVEMTTVAELNRDGYYLRRFAMGEHSGTHMNAPNSFFADGVGIDAYPAESLIVPLVVMDIQAQAIANPDYRLQNSDVQHWEQQHGTIPPGCVVILHTGWQAKWHDPVAFLNQDPQGIYHFPGFGAEVTEFLVQERAIVGVGTDTHGVDPGEDTTFSTNQQILANRGIVLENLTNLDQLPPIGATGIIGRLRLQGGSGSPVAILALF